MSDTHHRPSGRTALLGTLVLAGLLALGILPRLKQREALAQATREEKQEANAPLVEVVDLSTYVSALPDGAEGLSLSGTLEASSETPVAARASGYIVKRYVDIGSKVAGGQLLAEIAAPEADALVRQSQADRARAVAAQALAEAESHRSEANVDKSLADTKSAEAAIVQAKAQVDKARAQVAEVDAQLAVAKLRVGQAEQQITVRKSENYRQKGNRDLMEKTAKRWLAMAAEGAVSQQAADERQSAYLSSAAVVNEGEANIKAAEVELVAAQANVRAVESQRTAALEAVRAAELSVAALPYNVAASKANTAAARSGVASSKVGITVAKAQVGAAEAATDRLAILKGYTKVTAPFAGIVVARSADVGTLVGAEGAKATLFTLARTDTLTLNVPVPQSAAGTIHPGQTVTIRVPEKRKLALTGKVVRTAGALDVTTRSLRTEIEVPNADGSLLPGTFVRAIFDTANAKGGKLPRIPAAALVSGPEGTRVLAVAPDGIVKSIAVTLGRDFGSELEIKEGLTGTERLILTPDPDVHDGQKVTTTERKPEAKKP